MELSEVIQARRSVRRFKETPISEEMINEMLEAARRAPSPGNAQAHAFGVVQDQALKTQLAQAAGNQMWIATAPVVFACCGDTSWDLADQPEEDFGLIVNKLRFGADFIRFIQQYPDRKAAMRLFHNSAPMLPAEHIVLTAVSHGLSSCFVGYLDVDRASALLNLPGHLSCLFLLPVGYADEVPEPKRLKSMQELSFFDRWR